MLLVLFCHNTQFFQLFLFARCMRRAWRILVIFCVLITAYSRLTEVYNCVTRIRHKYVVQTKIIVEYVDLVYFLQCCKNGFSESKVSENVDNDIE